MGNAETPICEPLADFDEKAVDAAENLLGIGLWIGFPPRDAGISLKTADP